MSDAVELQAIDDAMIARYNGIQVSVDSVLTDVEVFMEAPCIEEFPERVYPSIAMRLLSADENVDVLESGFDEMEEVGYNSGVSPNERSMRQKPSPYTVTYALDAWSKQSAEVGRDMLSTIFIAKTPPKGYIVVSTIDGGTFLADVFWSGGIVSATHNEGDESIYHTSLTVRVNAWLTSVEATEIVSEKVAMNTIWNVFYEQTRTIPSVADRKKDVTVTDDGTTITGE
jgi:hypothetical protein